MHQNVYANISECDLSMDSLNSRYPPSTGLLILVVERLNTLVLLGFTQTRRVREFEEIGSELHQPFWMNCSDFSHIFSCGKYEFMVDHPKKKIHKHDDIKHPRYIMVIFLQTGKRHSMRGGGFFFEFQVWTKFKFSFCHTSVQHHVTFDSNISRDYNADHVWKTSACSVSTFNKFKGDQYKHEMIEYTKSHLSYFKMILQWKD